ncbi:hypothetical protein [Agreia sp. Leaf210]|uniref:hypothetical protein n=1 Tax=Agreia sp. Leaf210 TaxID=1735682 RepID=UPI0006FD2ACC|nr:hypothetical protein [Agreia sp. Leaf210]KQM60511.1 hypothetical protein ASE64_02175 [Agreia sp. Leaf210]
MIRRPGHTVNDTLGRTTASPLPAVEGLDARLASANVASWGGDPELYTRFFGTSLELELERGGSTQQPMTQTVLALAALAAWRSGVLDLRQDALGRLTEALESGSVTASVLASALGLQAGELADFVRCQAESPFGWPARGSGEVVVARVGGFRGLGGPWTAPPASAERLSPDGDFLITLADGEVWRLEADIFGTRLSRAEGGPDLVTRPRAEPAASEAWPIRVAVFDTSYLAWLVLGQAA